MDELFREISDGVFWIGTNSEKLGIYSNTYLIIDNNEIVLIDPTFIFFNEQLLAICQERINFSKVNYVILHHLSPIICMALPQIISQMPQAKIVIHERALSFLKMYVVENNIFCLSDTVTKIKLQSNRELDFIETPYLPSLETFLTYDSQSKILFTSLLFSAKPRKWNLFADRIFYKESMKAFHEQHIPSNEFLRPAMDMILKIMRLNGISMLASCNGSIIKDDLEKYIYILRDLYCGIAINPIKNDLTRKEGYISFCNMIIETYLETFSVNEVKSIFIDSTIVFEEQTMRVVDYPGSGEDLWENLFSLIYVVKGLRWLSAVFEQMNSFIKKYNVKKPSVFNHREQEIITLDKENVLLKERIQKLEHNLEHTTDSLVKDEITNLYNEIFLRNFLKTACTNKEQESFVLLLIEIDDIWTVKRKFGQSGEAKTIRIIQILADILKIDATEKAYQLFKMTSEGSFIFYIAEEKIPNVILFTEGIRNEVADSARFQENITISASLTSSDEFAIDEISVNTMLNVLNSRIALAKNKGSNQICFESDIKRLVRKTILIVENDDIYIEMISSALEHWNFDIRTCKTAEDAVTLIDNETPELVISELELERGFEPFFEIISCKDGFMASKMIEKDKPDIIIAELMIPKDDGLVVRERMLQLSASQNTPFILISHLKDEKTVDRAMELKVDHYLKKPFMMNELTGIVLNILNA